MKLFTADAVRLLEQTAPARGISLTRLMCNAADKAFSFIGHRYPLEGLSCTVACGSGNNGGDGFAVARLLHHAGAQVTIVLGCGEPKTADARKMYQMAKSCRIPVVDYRADPKGACGAVRSAKLIVDALFGTGFHGELREGIVPLFDAIGASGAAVVSLDLPSGVNADNGQAAAHAVQANQTVAFAALKPAHAVYPGRGLCGEIVLADIGIRRSDIQAMDTPFETMTRQQVGTLLPRRQKDTNKGDFGKLLCICGSDGMTGAACLSAAAAVRCGAGLCTLAAPAQVQAAVASKLNEPTMLLLPQHLGEKDLDTLVKRLAVSSACLLGCGLGQGERTTKLLQTVLAHANCPVILDADGINCLASDIDMIKTATAPVILTPHMGEMARLAGFSIEQVLADRLSIAQSFAKEHGVVLVLKGAGTIVATPDGRARICTHGNAGMSKGGSGDVLAGMIASFAAQGIRPADAAVCGVYLHACAGDRAARRLSQYAMTPTDMIGELGGLFLEYRL